MPAFSPSQEETAAPRRIIGPSLPREPPLPTVKTAASAERITGRGGTTPWRSTTDSMSTAMPWPETAWRPSQITSPTSAPPTAGASSIAAASVRLVGSVEIRSEEKLVATCAVLVSTSAVRPTTSTVSVTPARPIVTSIGTTCVGARLTIRS